MIFFKGLRLLLIFSLLLQNLSIAEDRICSANLKLDDAIRDKIKAILNQQDNPTPVSPQVDPSPAPPRLKITSKTSWNEIDRETKDLILNDYEKIPKHLKRHAFENNAEIKNRDFKKFVDAMVDYLDNHAPTYNPDFPFSTKAPHLTAYIITESKTGKILGGYVYVIRESIEDAGSAWIDGVFDYPLTYLASDELRWSHY
jgi:hypothetical protein